MLDTTMTLPKKEATEYAPLPDDMYQVEFFDVTAKQTETYDSKQERAKDSALAPVMETVLDFQFVVLEDGLVDDKPIRGRNIYHNFVPAYLYIGKKGKNDLYKIVEALQGEPLTLKQEAEGISGADLNALIGKQCRVVTAQKTKGDKTYMNIDNYLPVKTLLPGLTAQEKIDAAPKSKEAEEEATKQYEGEAVTN